MNKWKYAFLSLLTAFVVISVLLWHNGYFKPREGLISSDTVLIEKVDTVHMTDTFKITKFIPKEVIKTRVDTVYDSNGNGIELVNEHKLWQETVENENDTVNVDIWTSGIHTNVDSVSLLVNRREIIKTNTITITNTIYKNKPFTIQPQLGLGYGLINKKLDAYVGFGFGVNF